MRRPNSSSNSSFDPFTLSPLSAGDIIDRAVRIYREQFWALLQIVIWPSLIAYLGVIVYTFGIRNFSLEHGDVRILLGVVMFFGGLLIVLISKIGFYIMLGGAARSLVNYFLNGEPLRPREVYRAVRERFWSLLGATLMIGLILLSAFIFVYMLVVMGVIVYLLIATLVISSLPYALQVTIHLVFGALFTFGLLLLALLIFKRVVFIPQALMVEGRGVFSAISRSFALAGRDVRQIGTILLFDSWLTFSLFYVFLLPLGWYAWVRGINLFGSNVPVWYSIAYQTLGQVSEILLAPIAMLGFTMLYIDSRVRQEGYDVELLASRYLPPAPLLEQPVIEQVIQQPSVGHHSYSILGLDDYRPEREPAAAVQSGSPAVPDGAIETPIVTQDIVAAAVTAQPFVQAQAESHHEVQAEAASIVRLCHNCGSATNTGSRFDRFCQTCGTSFDEAISIEEGIASEGK